MSIEIEVGLENAARVPRGKVEELSLAPEPKGFRNPRVQRLLMLGGVFVIEALSVLLQVSVFKMTRRTTGTGRRLFKMTPLHHHFEMEDWKEPKIVFRFLILAILFALLSLSTLKLR